MRSRDEPATVADIERAMAASRAAGWLRRHHRRRLAAVLCLAVLGALVASALAPGNPPAGILPAGLMPGVALRAT